MKSVRILRVDPNRRTVATLMLKGVRDCTPQLRRLIRSNNLGTREIMKIEERPLMAIGGLEVDEADQGWRLPGTDDTSGVSVIAGRDLENNLVLDSPVTAAWVLERIQWLDGEDVEARDGRAAEMMPALNDQIRQALKDAVPTPDGKIWLTAAHRDIVGEAMQTLGLGTERSRGQMLTPLGEAVFDLISAEAA